MQKTENSGENSRLNEIVFCQNTDSYEPQKLKSAVEQIFAEFAVNDKLNASTKVLIKPNMLAKHAPEKAVTTHPALIEAVVLQCVKCGALPQNIIIADSPGGIYTKAIVQSMGKTCGYTQVCEKTGAQFYTDCNFYEKKINGKLLNKTHFIKPFESADFIINMPKLKTHVMMGLTCATKNLFGAVAGLYKAGLHSAYPNKDAFGCILVDICESINADLHIVDGILAHEGDGPSGGSARHANVLLSGTNPYAVDIVAANIIGKAASTVPYLAEAIKRGYCKENVSQMASVLKGSTDVTKTIKGFKLPSHYMGVDFATKVPPFMQKTARAMLNLFVPKPTVETAKCIGCAKCAEICPKDTIIMKSGKAKVIKKACIKCYCCHEMCPVKAIELKRGF